MAHRFIGYPHPSFVKEKNLLYSGSDSEIYLDRYGLWKVQF